MLPRILIITANYNCLQPGWATVNHCDLHPPPQTAHARVLSDPGSPKLQWQLGGTKKKQQNSTHVAGPWQ